MRTSLLLTLILLIAAVACRPEKDQELRPPVAIHTPFEPDVPYYFPRMDVPVDNPLTTEGIELGRRLYYDPILSSNGPFEGRSCSSCHFQSHSFSVPTAGRAVMPHVNLGYSRNFLWTGGVSGTLEDVMRFEVEDFFQVDVSVLQSSSDYRTRFRDAYGTENITQELVAKALAQWFRRLTSSNSKFDRYLMHTAALTPQELNGMMVYLTETGDCFHCHGIPLMSDNDFHNIGLDSEFNGADRGRFLVTGNPADMGAFKAPTLRNVALTAPYMHDGRFATLEEVVEHYNSGVQTSASLDPLMTKPGQMTHLAMTPMQKADLVTFLHTLTDHDFVSDTALASPFH